MRAPAQDFTLVCPTEIIAFSDRSEEFLDLNTQLIAGSTDTEEVRLSACLLHALLMKAMHLSAILTPLLLLAPTMWGMIVGWD